MMKISSLETFTDEFVCFVRLTTDSGAVGWGQTSTYNADITASIFHRQVAPWALGGDAHPVLTGMGRRGQSRVAAGGRVSAQQPVALKCTLRRTTAGNTVAVTPLKELP
jgi:L-alanine-DL-glutamate epimerase-like enolase superfamily enzyme